MKTLWSNSRSLYNARQVSIIRRVWFKLPRSTHVPDNIMNEASLLQMSRKVLPLPCLDLFSVLSPLLLALFHPPKILLRNASCLLCCMLGLENQCRATVFAAQRVCLRDSRDGTRCAWRSSGDTSVATSRSSERCRLGPHWTKLVSSREQRSLQCRVRLEFVLRELLRDCLDKPGKSLMRVIPDYERDLQLRTIL